MQGCRDQRQKIAVRMMFESAADQCLIRGAAGC
jgi:hypothetical protein